MSDLNQLGRQRRESVRGIRRAQKTLDSSVEQLERMLIRILSRKRNVPTVDDFINIGELIRAIDANLEQLFRVHNAALEVDMRSGPLPGGARR